MIKRLQDRIPAGAAGEFSSPQSTLYADSYFVSAPPPGYCSGTYRTLVILPKNAGGRTHLSTWYTLEPTKSKQADLTMPLSRHSVGTSPEMSSDATCWETFKHSATTVLNLLSHCRLILPQRVELVFAGWFPLQKRRRRKKKKRRHRMNSQTLSQNPCKWGKIHQIGLMSSRRYLCQWSMMSYSDSETCVWLGQLIK